MTISLRVVAVLGGVLALGACGGNPTYREWTAKDSTATAAFDECDEEIDAQMRLRGYPNNPLPETPQFKYRKTVFAQCMRRKGYESDE